jgi:hypothetical protein
MSLAMPMLLENLAKAAPQSGAVPDPKVLTIRTPKDIAFPEPEGTGPQDAQQIVICGNPQKEGSLYGIHLRWLPHSNSKPHRHKHDRHIYVLKGTWWLGTGPNYDDMKSTYPVGPGTYVYHKGMEIHYDGAKDEPVELLIFGIGPAANVPLPGQKTAAK